MSGVKPALNCQFFFFCQRLNNIIFTNWTDGNNCLSVITEITTLTTEESGDQTNLEATVAELSKLEKQETDAKVELESLHKTEWMNVVEREQVLEKNIKIQVTCVHIKVDVKICVRYFEQHTTGLLYT